MAMSRESDRSRDGLAVFRLLGDALRRFQAKACVWIAVPRLGAVNLLLELLLAALLTLTAFVPLDRRERE